MPYVQMSIFTLVEKVLIKNDMAANALPAIVTLRQPYWFARALTSGPIGVSKTGSTFVSHIFEYRSLLIISIAKMNKLECY